MRHLLNDSAKPVSENVLNAMRSYDVGFRYRHPFICDGRLQVLDKSALSH